ncbi:MAG: hypothetical protein EBU57_14285, partial [Alphaproteobacteria bacterium]|nr:hypothetical protein [Alphaproteobacteria bacterium]
MAMARNVKAWHELSRGAALPLTALVVDHGRPGVVRDSDRRKWRPRRCRPTRGRCSCRIDDRCRRQARLSTPRRTRRTTDRFV